MTARARGGLSYRMHGEPLDIAAEAPTVWGRQHVMRVVRSSDEGICYQCKSCPRMVIVHLPMGLRTVLVEGRHYVRHVAEAEAS